MLHFLDVFPAAADMLLADVLLLANSRHQLQDLVVVVDIDELVLVDPSKFVLRLQDPHG